jgi:hypothetical protein
MPELGLLNADGLAPMALSAAVLTHHPEGEPLRYPEHGAQGLNSPVEPQGALCSATSFLDQKFPSANSYCFAEACG